VISRVKKLALKLFSLSWQIALAPLDTTLSLRYKNCRGPIV